MRCRQPFSPFPILARLGGEFDVVVQHAFQELLLFRRKVLLGRQRIAGDGRHHGVECLAGPGARSHRPVAISLGLILGAASLSFGRRRPNCLPGCKGRPQQKRRGDRRRRHHCGPVPLGKAPKSVRRRGRPGENHVVPQVTLDILGEALRRRVAAVAILIEGLHHDPIEIAGKQVR